MHKFVVQRNDIENWEEIVKFHWKIFTDPHSKLSFFVLFVLGQNVVAEFVVHIDHFFGAASSASMPNASTLDAVFGFRL